MKKALSMMLTLSLTAAAFMPVYAEEAETETQVDHSDQTALIHIFIVSDFSEIVITRIDIISHRTIHPFYALWQHFSTIRKSPQSAYCVHYFYFFFSAIN